MDERDARSAQRADLFPKVADRALDGFSNQELDAVRALMRGGDFANAQRRLDILLDKYSPNLPAELLLTRAELLLARGRSFSAEQSLAGVLRPDVNPRIVALHAQAVADVGDAARAESLLTRARNLKFQASPMDDQLLTDLSPERATKRQTDRLRQTLSELESLSFFYGIDPFSPEARMRADEQLSAAARASQPYREGKAARWAIYLGEFCVRRLGAVWRWRRRVEDSLVYIPTPTGDLEVCPYVWASWRLASPQHRIGEFLSVLMSLRGDPHDVIDETLGEVELNGTVYEPIPGRHPLSEALHAAETASAAGRGVLALGVPSDCPFGRVAVPLVVESGGEPEVRLYMSSPEFESTFLRYLDMLALGPFGHLRWAVVTGGGNRPEIIAEYEKPDRNARAALVARRLCRDEPRKNARWIQHISAALFDLPLDGTPASLELVDDLVGTLLRPSGAESRPELVEGQLAAVFMLTCYCGEVLRSAYGGHWGPDRATGAPMGPTSGLEIGDVRFNIGAKVLRRFYFGDEALAPAAVRYVQLATGTK
ncbi:MAG: hypothetical protein KC561_03075 [Myxococcales bacterium]|nr:hypothetical protein [Myxococcales bacterium]